MEDAPESQTTASADDAPRAGVKGERSGSLADGSEAWSHRRVKRFAHGRVPFGKYSLTGGITPELHLLVVRPLSRVLSWVGGCLPESSIAAM